MGILVLLEEMLSLFYREYDVDCGFVIYVFYYVEVCSLCTHFVESFYRKWMLNFVKAFSASIEMIIWFSFFNSLMGCITLIVLLLRNNKTIVKSLHPWDNSHLIVMYDSFNVLINSICKYFVEDFYNYFISDIDL